MESKVDEGNWIYLYRELMGKPIWVDSTAEQKVILITILMMVQYCPVERDFSGELITVQPGQQITGYQKITDNCGKGVSIRNVRTALVKFKKYGFLTYKTTNKGMLVTVENWGLYQGADKQTDTQTDRQLTGNRQATDRQLTTNKNLRTKELKNLFLLPTDKASILGFGEMIYLAKAEYDYLVDQFGEEDAMRKILDLDRHKESTGARYESDFEALMDRIQDEVQS